MVSNIEEIYVDASYCVSDDYIKLTVSNKMEAWIMNGLGTENITELLKKFPRLKHVTIINGLGDIIKSVNPGDFEIHKLINMGVFKPNKYFTVKTPNFDKNQFGKLVIRSYYKFDKEILSDYNRQMQRDDFEHMSNVQADPQEANKSSANSQTQAVKSKLESKFEKIEQTSGIAVAKTIALELSQVCKFGSEESKSYDIKSLFTQEGYAKYFG